MFSPKNISRHDWRAWGLAMVTSKLSASFPTSKKNLCWKFTRPTCCKHAGENTGQMTFQHTSQSLFRHEQSFLLELCRLEVSRNVVIHTIACGFYIFTYFVLIHVWKYGWPSLNDVASSLPPGFPCPHIIHLPQRQDTQQNTITLHHTFPLNAIKTTSSIADTCTLWISLKSPD